MPETTVVALEALPLNLSLREPFAVAGGAPETAHNLLVRVTLADGSIGIGEAAPFTVVSGETQESAAAAVATSRSLLMGQDARLLLRLSQALGELLAEEPAARCALEQALLDALLRHYHMPMWAYFGGHATELETDITVTAGDRLHASRAAEAAAAQGFGTLKVKVGGASPAEDAERLREIRAAAPNLPLILDANGGYSAEQALELLDRLAKLQLRVALFEQPVHRSDKLGLLAVARRGGVPICADESARTVADVRWLSASGAVQAVNLKIMKSGLFETVAMYHLARSAGLELMIGGMIESVLAMTVSASLAAGLGGFAYVDLDTPLFIASHPFRGGFAQHGAKLRVGQIASGHGVSL